LEKIVECVPNFSEGRDKKILETLAKAISETEGVKLLSLEPGADTNRTVYTYAGTPEGVLEAAKRVVAEAVRLIDMTKHKGAHPRIGAVDVFPFIPVSGVTMEDCIALARELAAWTARELGVPVYLYGRAAQRADRVRLPDIRKGEYEALPSKLKDPSFAPDFGPAQFLPKTGAMVTGARDFLLAYNVNLNTRSKEIADTIAGIVRESGRSITDKEGKRVRIPGKLKACQAGGWYIEEYGYAQVTVNLSDYRTTGFHTLFEAVSKEAEKLGCRVTGSELIGLTPKEALLQAGNYYLSRQGVFEGKSEEEIIQTAVRTLGLSETHPFVAEERVIEYALEKGKYSFPVLTVRDFLNTLGADTPVPGGGTVAANSLALAASLTCMVAGLTFGKKGYEKTKKMMQIFGKRSQEIKEKALFLMDADTRAYTSFIEALRLPKDTEKEKKIREAAREKAALEIIEMPFETLILAEKLLSDIEVLHGKGLQSALTDIAVGALEAEAAARGAWYNVLTNLPLLKERKKARDYLEKGQILYDLAESKAKRIKQRTLRSLKENIS